MKSHRNAVMTSALALLLAGAWCSPAGADTAGHKAGRGLAAISTPFLEIPGNVIATNRREGPVEAWTMGLARGIGMTIVRPGVGVYELVTAPFPMPENYEPILEPEYPWSYFGSGQRGVATR
ncbi:MAG TPA: exosortase system-associated protein, TIGR04073 family [Myxococcota bacterium]|nr:exosortase system-associated protein, TIGR04073 family [Myxococcota bacterium]